MILVNNRLKFPIWFVDWVRWTWSGNLLGKLKYSQEDSLGLEFAFVFLLSFPSHKSLMGKRRREWKRNEGKKKKPTTKHVKGSLTPHTSILRAGKQRLQIILHKSKVPHSFHRKPFQKYIPRALFSQNTAHHEWTVLRLTWHSDLVINEKWWKVQPFPFYDAVWNDRTGNQKPGESLSQTTECHCGPQHCGWLILESKGSLNPFRLLFYLICMG